MLLFQDFSCQGDEISSLEKQIKENRLVHALLICGEPGTGKRSLVSLIARSLVCESDHGPVPCNNCDGCRLAMAGEHPDITVIEKGKSISADQTKNRSSIPVGEIREVIRICNRFPYKNGNRVIMIHHAEDMTPQAQNSLLKIIEEPPEHNFFLLTSTHPGQLLTTVRSRCRIIKLRPWNEKEIESALIKKGIDAGMARKAAASSSGSIGKAIRISSDDEYWQIRNDVIRIFFGKTKRSDILSVSKAWKDRKQDADRMLDILEHSVHLLLECSLGIKEKQYIEEFSDNWQRFASSASPERYSFLEDSIYEARKQVLSNVNFQAVFEQLLLVFIGESELWSK